MTDSEINKTIAEYIQWKPAIIPRDMTGKPFEGWDIPPDCCNDLNEMHEAEKVFIKGDPGLWECYKNRLNAKYGIDAIHATARERAETFLKTICKWKD